MSAQNPAESAASIDGSPSPASVDPATIPGPQTANLGDGANGRLSEAAVACGCGHGVSWHHDTRGCGYHGYSTEHRCPCLLLPDGVVCSIVREHTERAWDEGWTRGAKDMNESVRWGESYCERPANPYAEEQS